MPRSPIVIASSTARRRAVGRSVLGALILLGSLGAQRAAAALRAPAAGAAAGTQAVRTFWTDAADETRIIDLAASAEGHTVIAGAPDKEQLGNDLKAGDLNADGRLDLILGAHWGSAGGRNIVGRAYALFGREHWESAYDMAQQLPGLWSFMGVGREARMGVSVAAGDVSGDRVADLVIGSLLADPSNQANAGAVYVMFGGPSAGGRVDFLNTNPDVVIAGESTPFDSDRLGTDVVVGDFNGDAQGDIAAAAVLRRDFAGGVFIWFGPFTKGRTINMRTTKPDRTILGGAERSYFGTALLAADIDADRRTDLVVGAWSPAPLPGPPDGGAVHIFRGQTLQSAAKDLGPADADISVIGPAGSTLSGALSLGQCSCHGQPLVFAELNGDGVRDLAVGAALDDGRRGRIYVLPGPLVGRVIDLAHAPHLTLTSTIAEGKLGWALAAGELDADAQADLVVALPSASVTIAGGGSRSEGGLVVGLRGPLPVTGTLDVERAAVVRILGPDVNSGGSGVTTVLADTDGDGADDLHMGFPNAPGLGRRSVGEAHILKGPLVAALPSPTAPPSPTPTATIAPSATPSATPSHTSSPTPPASPSPAATAGASATAEPPTSAPTARPTARVTASAGHDGRAWLPFAFVYRPRRRP